MLVKSHRLLRRIYGFEANLFLPVSSIGKAPVHLLPVYLS